MPKQLSQYKPSDAFVSIFGAKPFKPDSGESYIDMRGRQVDYLQHVKDWDRNMVEATVSDALYAALLQFGLGDVRGFTVDGKPDVFLTFPSVKGFDIWSADERLDLIITRSQARKIAAGEVIPDSQLYPNPGLQALNNELKARIAADEPASEVAEA